MTVLKPLIYNFFQFTRKVSPGYKTFFGLGRFEMDACALDTPKWYKSYFTLILVIIQGETYKTSSELKKMTASLKSEETSQDVNVSQGNQIVQKRFFIYQMRKEKKCNVIIIISFFIQTKASVRKHIDLIFNLVVRQLCIYILFLYLLICSKVT